MIPLTTRPFHRSKNRRLEFLRKKREDLLGSGLFKNKATKHVSRGVSDRMGTILRQVRKVASNRSFINDLTRVINDQEVSRKMAFRKMVHALPTLEDKLNEIEAYYNRFYPAEQIKAKDLDGVGYWPPVDGTERKKFLSLLMVRVNEYIQDNDDKDCHETIRLPEEYVGLLEHCDAVQDPHLRSIKAACLVPLNSSVEGTIALCTQDGEPPGTGEFKTEFMIDRTRLMYCVYGYTRYREDYVHPPNAPFPERKATREDYEREMAHLLRGYRPEREQQVRSKWGSVFAAAQVNKPNFMLGNFSDTESVATVDTVIIDDDGNDIEPFTDDEDDGKNEDRD
ncbi:hypothetical protein SI65_05156 [Aspergillus cristatus]|uniref:Uncharacterized protein n=1 Tax=Aspergillus cristatus TaxID=573508 RepID=A0A1E3BGZ5_ASPCR|nr:hypothetical protein SI65_05156 [Aspergillus cristatus]